MFGTIFLMFFCYSAMSSECLILRDYSSHLLTNPCTCPILLSINFPILVALRELICCDFNKYPLAMCISVVLRSVRFSIAFFVFSHKDTYTRWDFCLLLLFVCLFHSLSLGVHRIPIT